MFTKNKPVTNLKKPQNLGNMKDIFQQTQITAELLRIVISRSEDLATLKSLSDRKSGKLRMQSVYAEKALAEIEFKEEWRYSKEDSLLLQLFTSRCEILGQKKQLDKIARKMARINMQFEDDPSEKDLNLSEIHLQKVMSVRISQENTSVNYNEKGQTYISLPALIIPSSVWRESYSQVSKVIEGCLSGEVLIPYASMFLCVNQSRCLYSNEMARQKLAIDEGLHSLSPNIAVMITLKKSKQAIAPQKVALSPLKKNAPLPEPDYVTCLLGMMLEANTEVDKAIKNFSTEYYKRNTEDCIRTCKSKDFVSKALRARDYEKFSAVNPWGKNNNKHTLSTVKTLKSLHMRPQVLFDLENKYFDENFDLGDRVKVIHSCLIIQNLYRERKLKEIEKKVVVIQKFVRVFLNRKLGLRKQTENFRKTFYWQRLKHWYPLMVNRFRERKSQRSGKDFSIFTVKVIMIQKNFRGFLVRKNVVVWKRLFFQLRQRKTFEKFYKAKQTMWRISKKYEDLVMLGGSFEISSNYSVSTEGDYSINTCESQEKGKEETVMRKQYFILAKSDRIQSLN